MNITYSAIIVTFLLSAIVSAEKTVLLIAGPKSHGAGQHEHPAGCELLAKHINAAGLDIKAEVSLGWPSDPAKAAIADALLIYSDGQDLHAAKGHVEELRQRLDAGKGLMVIHYALEPSDAAMAQLLDDAIGGHFKPNWSVNPVWQMKDPLLAEHAVTRGVRPFHAVEEFYYHIHFRDHITHLLRALPPADSLGDDGPRSGNPTVRKLIADKVPQTLAWAVENPSGARGFGFTGGHFHHHWANENFRKLVLNAIVWTTGTEVPEGGITSSAPATPIHQTIDEAIAKDDIEDVKLHLSCNPESALKGGRASSRPPLEQAILRNKTDIAILLLENKADPNSTNASMRTPLHLAIERNNPALVSILLKAGAKPDARDKAGWTPLHHAAAKNQLASAKTLLDGGANVMVLSELGGTPLHEAAASGSAEIIHLFLDHKVDPSVISKQGVTALDLAKKYKNQAAIDALTGK